MTFKQSGGTVSMYGYSYKLIQRNLPLLVQGGDYLLMLKHVEGKFVAAGLYFGVFQSTGNKLKSIGVDGFVPELNNLTADEAVAYIINRIQAVRR